MSRVRRDALGHPPVRDLVGWVVEAAWTHVWPRGCRGTVLGAGWEFRWCSSCHDRIPQTDIRCHSSGSRKSETKVPAGWVSAETTFSSCPRRASPQCAHLSYFFLFLRGHQSQWIRAPPLGPHVTLITSRKAPSANAVTLGVRASTYDFGGHNSVYDRWGARVT